VLLLTSTSDIVRVVTGSAATVNAHASWMDNASGTITPGRTNTAAISSATTTTVVGSPGGSTQRNVKNLTIRNTHASISTTVEVQHYDGTNSESLWSGTLGAGESVTMTDNGDWQAYSSAGLLKTGSTTLILTNRSTSTVSAGYAVDTYLAGSNITMPTAGPVVGTTYHCLFDMVKTGAGTAAFTANVRFGTAGTVSDTSILSLAFAVGTGVIDTGTFELWLHFRTVGSGTSAVVVGTLQCRHHLAATGLVTTGASGMGQITSVSSGFNSTTAGAILGLSVNGGTSFSGTNTIVEAQLLYQSQ
jgi:hypothetical protein